MEEFVPFHAFLDQLRAAGPAGEAARGPRAVAGQGEPEGRRGERPIPADHEAERRRAYLASHYQDAQVVHSFVDDDGQYIDCIVAGTQPGLRGGQPMASPPPVDLPEGAVGREGEGRGVDPQLARPRVDRFGNLMQCPAGSVPVRRITPEQLARFGTLENYFEKAPGGGALPPTA